MFLYEIIKTPFHKLTQLALTIINTDSIVFAIVFFSRDEVFRINF